MKLFIKRLLRFSLFGIISFVILLVFYVVSDPFKVVHFYENFYPKPEHRKFGYVGLNKDYVSTTTFTNAFNRGIRYNSFIFGNSRSIFYQVVEWKKFIGSDNQCYHFDASGEDLWAINKKLSYLDSLRNNIEHVLLVLDYSTLKQIKPRTGHLFMPSPQLLDNENFWDFQYANFSAFLSPKFLYAFTDFTLTGQVKEYMKADYLLDDRPYDYDPMTNELQFNYFEDLIRKGVYYTPERKAVFFNRDTTANTIYDICIGNSQKNILLHMSSLLKRKNTKYRIIINPLYDQKKINPIDMEYLKTAFGKENVFDFSGVNDFTNSFENYYESSHYRPHIAKEIMRIIYSQ